MNSVNYINTMPCPIKSNSNTIELTVHTSCNWGLRLNSTICDSRELGESQSWKIKATKCVIWGGTQRTK